MRDDIKIGDEIVFYPSNCKESSVIGVMHL